MRKGNEIIRVQLHHILGILPIQENFFLNIENAEKCFAQHIKDHAADRVSKADLDEEEPLEINTKNGRDKEATMYVWRKCSHEHNEYDVEPISVSLEFIKMEDDK